jgi:hypothetical protein
LKQKSKEIEIQEKNKKKTQLEENYLIEFQEKKI